MSKTETRWVIVGDCGLYEGQWQTRKAAIWNHVHDTGRGWGYCRRKGDRAVKAKITFPQTYNSPQIK